MLDIFLFFLGMVVGFVSSYIISFIFLLKENSIKNSKNQEDFVELHYSIDKVWHFLAQEKFITCYKAYSSSSYELELGNTNKSLVIYPTMIIDQFGEAVFINAVKENCTLEFGQSPFQSDHFLKLYRVSNDKTILVVKRIVRPEIEWGRGFFNNLLRSSFGKPMITKENFVGFTINNIKHGLKKVYGS